jgi:hypothetical protein
MIVPDNDRVVAEAQRLLDTGVMITRAGAALEVLEADGGRASKDLVRAVVAQLIPRLGCTTTA